MKQIGVILVVLLAMVSCGEKIMEQPEDLIPKEKMVQILYDFAVVNAAKNTNSVVLEDYFESPTSFVFKKHGVDSLQFVHSDLYYASQPLLYEGIYKEVVSKLEDDKDRMEEARKKANDSIAIKSRKFKDTLNQ
jgi:hypothetical protein